MSLRLAIATTLALGVAAACSTAGPKPPPICPPSPIGACPGDIDGSGAITSADIQIITALMGQTCYRRTQPTLACAADLDRDGIVTMVDVGRARVAKDLGTCTGKD